MIPPREAAAALLGLSRLLRRDRQALAYFPATLEGFWNSFWIAALVAPVYILQSLAFHQQVEMSAGPLRYVFIEFNTYLLSWFLFPLLMVAVCESIGRRQRYFHFLVPYNWFQLVMGMILLPLVIANTAGLLPQGFGELAFFLTYLLYLYFSWFMARDGLQIGGGGAAAIILLAQFISFALSGLKQGMMGIPPP